MIDIFSVKVQTLKISVIEDKQSLTFPKVHIVPFCQNKMFIFVNVDFVF